MIRKIFQIVLVAALAFLAGGIFAGAAMKMAAEPVQIDDPKKKKAGEECKTSNECQNHHSCTKNGDKNLCTAPPPPKLPPGVVT